MPEPSHSFAAFAVYAERSGLNARIRALFDALSVHRHFSLHFLYAFFGVHELNRALAERAALDGEIVQLRAQISDRQNAISAAAFLSPS